MSNTLSQCCLVWVTVPDSACAEKIAAALVEQRLAACVSILPGVQSHYRWQGKCESACELQLCCKSTLPLFDRLTARVKELHPYQCPEILATPIAAGSPDYLAWIQDNTVPA